MSAEIALVRTRRAPVSPVDGGAHGRGAPARRRRDVRGPSPEHLPTVKGVEWTDGFRGRVETACGIADARIEGEIGIRVELPLDGPDAPERALEINAALPGNLRYSGPRHARRLVADAPLDVTAFPDFVRELHRGLRRISGAGKARARASGAAQGCDDLFEELRRLGGAADVVERGSGFELGTRIRGARVPVRVTAAEDGVRVHRAVVGVGSDCDHAARWALGDAALRLNARTRFVRLAADDAGLALEALLGRRRLDPRSVLDAARAVAAVSVAVTHPLELLTRHESAARCYFRTFNPQHRRAIS